MGRSELSELSTVVGAGRTNYGITFQALRLYITDEYLFVVETQYRRLVNPFLEDFGQILERTVSSRDNYAVRSNIMGRATHLTYARVPAVYIIPPTVVLPEVLQQTFVFCSSCGKFYDNDKPALKLHVKREHKGTGYAEEKGYKLSIGPEKSSYILQCEGKYDGVSIKLDEVPVGVNAQFFTMVDANRLLTARNAAMLPKQNDGFRKNYSETVKLLKEVAQLFEANEKYRVEAKFARQGFFTPSRGQVLACCHDATRFMMVYQTFHGVRGGMSEVYDDIGVNLAKGDKSSIMVPFFITMMKGKDEFCDPLTGSRLFNSCSMLFYLELRGVASAKRFEEESFNLQQFKSSQALHFRLHRSQPEPKLDQSSDGIVKIGDIPFSVNQISTLASHLMKMYRQNVKDCLPQCLAKIEVHYDSFVRNLVDSTTGSSSYPGPFYDSVDSTAEIVKEYQKTHWGDKRKMIQELEKLSGLNHILFVLIQITCGMPFRVGELASLAIAGDRGASRGVFCFEEQIHLRVTVDEYKSGNTSQSSRRYFKLLSKGVSMILIHYIRVVRSIEISIADEFMSTDSPPGYVVPVFEDDDDENGELTASDPKARYSDLLGVNSTYHQTLRNYLFLSYCEHKDPHDIFRSLSRYSDQFLGCTYSNRAMRQALAYFTKPEVIEAKLKEVGSSYEAINIDRGIEEDKKDDFNEQLSVSRNWHKLLDLTLESEPSPPETPVSNIAKIKKIIDSRAEHHRNSHFVDVLAKNIYGPEFEFHGPQKLGVIRSFLSTNDLIYVSPAGTGKSELFKIPCFTDKYNKFPFVTIVVLPTISRLDDLYLWANTSSHPTVSYYSPRAKPSVFEDADMVLVMWEDMGSIGTLVEYFKNSSARMIRRVVIDYAHVLTTWKHSPIAKQELPSMFDDIPKLFLSSAMTTEAEAEIKNLFSSPQIIRSPIVGTNVKHQFFKSHKSRWAAIVKHVHSQVLPLGRKMVVFVSDEEEVRRLGNELKMLTYPESCKERLQRRRWKEFNGDENAIIASPSFAYTTGIEGISHVLVLGDISAIDFQQVTAMLNRQNSDECSYVYQIFDTPQNHFYSFDKCVNQVLTSTFDQCTKSCKELNAPPCDFCEDREIKGYDFGSGNDDDDEELIPTLGMNIARAPLSPQMTLFVLMFEPAYYGFKFHDEGCKSCGLLSEYALMLDIDHKPVDNCVLKPVLALLTMSDIGNSKLPILITNAETMSEYYRERFMNMFHEGSRNYTLRGCTKVKVTQSQSYLRASEVSELRGKSGVVDMRVPHQIHPWGEAIYQFFEKKDGMETLKVYGRKFGEKYGKRFGKTFGPEDYDKVGKTAQIWSQAVKGNDHICSKCGLSVPHGSRCQGDNLIRALIHCFAHGILLKDFFEVQFDTLTDLFEFMMTDVEWEYMNKLTEFGYKLANAKQLKMSLNSEEDNVTQKRRKT